MKKQYKKFQFQNICLWHLCPSGWGLLASSTGTDVSPEAIYCVSIPRH
jgi:hypothetical protein